MRRIISRTTAAAAGAAGAAALCAATALPAEAQFFGRNKVQYEKFDFNVLSTEHFDLHYYPSAAAPTRDAAFMAERWYTRLAGVLSHEMLSRQQLILYADHSDFQQTNVVDGTIDESTGGITESLQRRVVMPLTPSYRESDQILGHELVHAFQYDIAARNGGIRRLDNLPLWAVEGMAEYLSTGRHDVQTATWLRDAVLHDDVPTLRKLSTDSRYFPYRFGAAVWAYIGGRFGDERVGEIFGSALRDGMNGGLMRVLGVSSDSLAADWVRDVKAAYAPLIEGRTHPDSVGRRLSDGRGEVAQLMLGPSVSPDGRHVVFAFARGFSLDLYLADAQTGRIIRRLVRGTADPHYDAVSFTGSAGSWSPDGSRFAAVVFADGNQQLALIDVVSARVEQRITIPGVGLITTPAWSPDGRAIAFSGMAGGVSDLYVVDAAGSAVRQLTADRYSDLQPSWSPDGRSLAFVTDRADAPLFDSLERATKRIAILDVATGAIRDLALMPGNTVNPQFSPDGTDLYFLAEPDGFRDIYRVHLPTDELYRVTRIATGVTGLTSYSPALSVAASTGELVFSVFNRRGYVLAALGAEHARGARVDPAQLALDNTAGMLLPFAASGRVQRYLADAHTGMPDSTYFSDRSYAARPRLSYLGMPSLGINYDAFGVAVYANMSGYFTDVLGQHSLYLQGMMNGGWKEIGGQATYESRGSRLNWALSAGRLPYVTRFLGMYPVTVEVNGRPTVGNALDEYSERLVINRAIGTTRYPLSATKRLELGGGLSHITYSAEVNRIVTVGSQQVRETFQFAPPVSYTLWQASAALVGDHTSFGIASPMEGTRYRLEVQPIVGTLNVNTLIADWRSYRLRRPFTFAVRASHFGRYGGDADRPELGTMFIGGPGMVRGYAYESFTTADCAGAGTQRCMLLDRLLGSSIALGSAEVRVPLLGSGRYALLDFDFIPTELALFADAGAAWTRAAGPSLDGGRGPVSSVGVSARFNVFGMLVIETYYAVPFQRSTGAQFGVQFVPGW